MEISQDVTFNEEAALKRSRKCQHEEVYEEGTSPRNKESTCLPEDEAPKEHDIAEPQEPPIMEISRKRKLLGEEKLYEKQKDMEPLKAP